MLSLVLAIVFFIATIIIVRLFIALAAIHIQIVAKAASEVRLLFYGHQALFGTFNMLFKGSSYGITVAAVNGLTLHISSN